MSIFFKRDADALAFGLIPAYRKYELRQARYHEMLPALGDRLKELGPGARVLDIASGWGWAKFVLDTVATTAEWTAIEVDEERAAECRRLGYVDVIDVNLEKDALPFPDASFDIVIASHILEHLENTAEALADWHRVLKPGGLMLIGVPMHLMGVSWLMRFWYRVHGRPEFGHCVFFSMPSLRRFLKGYEVLRIWGFRFFSARKELPLEDWEWFYRFSLWVGSRLPNVTQEVNVVIRKDVLQP